MTWSRLRALAGDDHMHVNGLQITFSESDESVIRSAKALNKPMFVSKTCIAMPVFSSGLSVVQPPETYRQLGHANCICTSGSGIVAHSDGPTAGV